MNTARLEAFSDAVMAVIITIMVLELKAPAGADLAALRPLAPVFLAYVLSFSVIGIFWNNHHHLLRAAQRVSPAIMWTNLHFLFWISLIPLSTAWLGQNYRAAWPTALYGGVQLLAGAAYQLLERGILAEHPKKSLIAASFGRDAKGKASLALYFAAIGLAFAKPWVSDVLFAVVAVIWFIPDQRFEPLSRKS